MKRPVTAKGNPKLSKGYGKDNTTASGRQGLGEPSDFKISGKELTSNASASNLPRYRSIQMNLEDGPQNEKESANLDPKARRLSRSRAGDGSGSAHHSSRHPQMGVKGFGSATFAGDGAGASPPTANVQPRQKKIGSQRQSGLSKGKPSVGFGSSAMGARGTPQSKTNNFMRKQDHVDMHTSGVAVSKLGKGKNNNDLCAQLDASTRFERHLQGRMAENDSKAGLNQPHEEDEIMREAAAALAETESVLKTRKDALIARHVDGRESLQDLDRVFKADERPARRDQMMSGNRADDHDGIGGFENYLDQHRNQLDHYKMLVEDSQQIGKGLAAAKARDGLFEWNSRIDKEFGLDAAREQREKKLIPTNSSNDAANELLSLELDAHQTRRQPGRGVQESTQSDHVGAKESLSPGEHQATNEDAHIKKSSAPDENEGSDSVRRERERMLELIRQRKKTKFEENKEEAPRTRPLNFTSNLDDGDILAGLGSNILQDLEASAQKLQQQQEDKEDEDGQHEEDSEAHVIAETRDKLDSDRRRAERDLKLYQGTKKVVRFADDESQLGKDQVAESDRGPRQSNSSSSEENNKLADLNLMLKENNFVVKADDEADFEIFMAKLHEKRRIAEGAAVTDTGSRYTKSSHISEIPDLDQASSRRQHDAYKVPDQPVSLNREREEEIYSRHQDSSDRVVPSRDPREAEGNEQHTNQGDPEQESSDEDAGPISKTQKHELKKLDDQIESLLKINTGDFFGGRPAAAPAEEENTKPSPKKDAPQSPKAVDRSKLSSRAGADNKKYDDFMKFMENIEEEISSQCERSAQRQKKDRQELDDILQRSMSQYDNDAKANLFEPGVKGEDDANRQALARIDQIDSTRSMIDGRAERDAGAIPAKSAANALLTELQNIEESIASHQSKHSTALVRATQDAESSHRSGIVATRGPSLGNLGKVDPKEAYQKIREKMLALEIEKDEQQKALELMKEVREREKAQFEETLARTRADGGKYADQVKNEMALRIEKQVQMIEALLEDKRQLQESMEKMQDKMKDTLQTQEKQRRVLEERLQVELKKNKDAWMASEKIRKERWEKDKVQEIRAQTVKGLEPEIQRIVERNKDDIRRLEEKHQSELRAAKEQVLLEQERKFQELRERLAREKEEALDQERAKTQAKLHDQYERLESQFDEERMRWKNNVYNEYDRLESMRKREKENLEDQIKDMALRIEKEADREREKWEAKAQEQQRKHEIQLKKLKEEKDIEKEEWMNQNEKRMEEQKQEYQKKIREEMVRERNKEIEAIINKLGDETHDTQKQLMQQYERKVNEVEQKWRAEVGEQKATIQSWKEKHKKECDDRIMLDENLRVLSRRINDLELDIESKKERIQQLEGQQFGQNEELAKARTEQETLRQEVESEMRARIDAKEREVRSLRTQIQQRDHEHALEVEQLQNANKNDLEVIQDKVQVAMAKKKEIIDALHDEIKLKDLQVTKLKEMLEKQRRELLS